MRKLRVVLVAVSMVILGGYLVRAQQNAQPAAQELPRPANLPEWAYAVDPPPPPGGRGAPPPDDGTLRHVPGSKVGLTATQVRGRPDVPDWFPEEHGPSPAIVKSGKDSVRACGFCHLSDGKGRTDNASPAGLPAAYIIQQMADFKIGLRKSSDPKKTNVNTMVVSSNLLTDEETKAAADYFASTTYSKWIRVVETTTVPKVRTEGGLYYPLEGAQAGQEPIGIRIIEVPEDPALTDLRDTHSGFIAYVPVGSVKKGEALVAKAQCTFCHGPDLGGMGPVPPIAGRSAQYMTRQMFDIQTGARRGPWSELMKPVVARFTNEDFVDISAYVASLTPPVKRPEASPQTRSR